MPVRKHGQRWQVRVAVGGGRRIEQTLPRGATRTDALALETAIRRAQIDAAAGRDQRYTLDQAIDQWLPAAQRLKSWQKDLRYRVDVLRGYTRGRPLEAIGEVAREFTNVGLQAGYSAAHINRHLAILRRVGRLAHGWGWLQRLQAIELLPGEKQRHVYLTPAQVRKLMRGTDSLTADMILFAALTGLRRGEMLRLTPDNIRGTLIVLDSTNKSGRPRTVPMPPEAARIARRRVPFGMGVPLFNKRFRAARVAAGLPHVRMHDLRHTFASWLVQAGESLSSVRDLLGHSSSAVTDRYAHLAPRHLVAAIAKLPRVRDGTKPKGQKVKRERLSA